jgi:CSLREA domain-containing protein
MRTRARSQILLWLVVAVLVLGTAAQAATITVTTLADNTTVDGLVTLREAIIAANTDTSVDGRLNTHDARDPRRVRLLQVNRGRPHGTS